MLIYNIFNNLCAAWSQKIKSVVENIYFENDFFFKLILVKILQVERIYQIKNSVKLNLKSFGRSNWLLMIRSNGKRAHRKAVGETF